CELLPHQVELYLDPVYSSYYDHFYAFEDFEGFLLSELTPLASLMPRSLRDDEAVNDWVDAGKRSVLETIDLSVPERSSVYETTVEFEEPCSHLRLSFKLADNRGNELSTS